MSRSILLADDSVTIQKVVALTFENSDFDVVGVTSGDAALTTAQSALPDLVIADVHMPGASGYEVARAIKDLSADTPVLLLVGTFEPFDEEQFKASSADGYLLKPFESGELRERVEALVGAEAAPSDDSDSPPPAEEPAPDEEALEVAEAEPSGPGEEAAVVLAPEDVDRIAHRVVELMSAEIVREVAHEVVPRVAETAVRRRIEELEREEE